MKYFMICLCSFITSCCVCLLILNSSRPSEDHSTGDRSGSLAAHPRLQRHLSARQACLAPQSSLPATSQGEYDNKELAAYKDVKVFGAEVYEDAANECIATIESKPTCSDDELAHIFIAPFSVPTDPVFSARSETYEDPFGQYALPQAVLKFRQGFGRLIRSSQDRGVVVVLDRRTTSRAYGATFVKSLPPCRLVTPTLREMPDTIVGWLRRA